MIEFHSHILPGMDDGSDSVETSLLMLEESRRQGVDLIFATSHFYACETDPDTFLKSRERAFSNLRSAMQGTGYDYPEILLGAEVLYFPGMSFSEELRSLTIEHTPFLLIEPPMIPWTDSMLDEIEETGQNLKLIPVIAHIDRYMRILRDRTLIDRVSERRILIQVNASYFLHKDTAEFALNDLIDDRFQFIGSDCHNISGRAPNLGEAMEFIRRRGYSEKISVLDSRINYILDRA